MGPRPSLSKCVIWQVALAAITVFLVLFAYSSYNNLKKMRLEFNEKKSTLIKENLDLKSRLDSIQEMIDQKTISFDVLGQEKKKMEEEVGLLKKENDRLIGASKSRLRDVKQQNAVLKKKIAALENSPLVQKIKETLENESNESVKKVVEGALNKIELIKGGNPVALEPIVVTVEEGEMAGKSRQEGEAPAPRGDVKGAILSVDRKDNLIVINIGSKENVREGDRLEILKDAKEIARAEVISARSGLSAAVVESIDPAYTINSIKENDDVIVLAR